MATAHAGPERLTELPLELLLEIITLLPMRQTMSLRQLSRSFKKLVDGNEPKLTRHSLVYNPLRLNSRHRRLTDFRGLELVDVVHQYMSYYGVMYELNDFDDLQIPWRSIFVSFQSALVDCIPGFANADPVTHGDAHVSEDRSMPESLIHFPLASPTDPSAPFFGDFESLTRKLEDPNLLRGPHHTRIHGMPDCFLTWRIEEGENFEERNPGPWDHGEIDVTMGLLRVPNLERRFSYCIKSKTMASVFWNAMDGYPDFAASQFRQAAVLEELYIW
ncbi:hypothetical protein LTR95_012979 [Oleoguttula sp. CCFEE 5521]